MAQDKFGYIPAGVQRQMDQHMQNMPAHLQQYQGGNKYIPQKAAQEMAGYMKKTMPAHMQEYISPYMERQTQAGLNALDPVTAKPVQERAPAPDLMRRDHSAFGEQFTVDTSVAQNTGSLSFSPQYSPQSQAPAPAPPPAPLPPANQSPYGFIMQEPGKQQGFSFRNKKQVLMLALVVLVVLALIIIIASVATSGSKGTTETMVGLAQEETELVRVTDIGVHKARSTDTKALATTTQLAVLTTQQETVALLKKEGHKLNSKSLALKKDPKTDDQLNTAALDNTFDDAFTAYIQQALAAYQKDLKQAYDLSKSKSEKAILASGYNGVNVILADKGGSSSANVQPN